MYRFSLDPIRCIDITNFKFPAQPIPTRYLLRGGMYVSESSMQIMYEYFQNKVPRAHTALKTND